jgi:hypothetical protein
MRLELEAEACNRVSSFFIRGRTVSGRGQIAEHPLSDIIKCLYRFPLNTAKIL